MTAYDDLQRRITQDALSALAGTDFALAGAGAIRAHGLTDRPTQDVDLFTASLDTDRFTEAVDRLGASLMASGHQVTMLRRAATFARLQATTPEGIDLEVDLAADWRSVEPVILSVGPVLAMDDAVGSKLSALYSRAETRDFLDVDAIRRSGRYTDAQLIALIVARDPGFEPGMFAAQLRLVTELTAAEVARYSITADELSALQRRLLGWAAEHRP